MEHYFYILIGASASGKGTLMTHFCEEGLWERAKKYSTRGLRENDANEDITPLINDEIIDLEKEEKELNKRKEENDSEEARLDLFVVQNKLKDARLSMINKYCGGNKGIVYFLNGNFYGIQIDSIPERLQHTNVAVVCSDFHVIERLKSDSRLTERVRIVYIATTIDEKELLRRFKEREETKFDGISDASIQEINDYTSVLTSASRLKYYSKIEEVMPELNERWNSILPYFNTIKARATNIRLLYNRYIDHIAEIDCPILNFDSIEFMFGQLRNYILHSKPKRKFKSPPIFMVCAPQSSGKATLMNIVGGLGEVNKNIVITKKYADREERKTDLRDGMKALNKKGAAFFEEIKKLEGIRDDDIWSWNFHDGKNWYAVSLKEIRSNIEKGQAQIFISNIGQIKKARELFPDNLVVLYLHAAHKSETEKHIRDKRRHDTISKACTSNCIKTIDESDRNNKSVKYKWEKRDGVPLSVAEAKELFEESCLLHEVYEEDVKASLNEIAKVFGTIRDPKTPSFADNNYNIDHVLLNTGTNNDLIEQMMNLINAYSNDQGISS